MTPPRDYFMLANVLIDQHMSEVDPTAGWVYVALSRHANPGRTCFPSINTLADETGLSGRSVQRAIARLKDAGWLTVERSPGGRGQQNRYRLLIVPPHKNGDTHDRVSDLNRDTGDRVSEPETVTLVTQKGDTGVVSGKRTKKNKGEGVDEAVVYSLGDLISSWNTIRGVSHCLKATDARRRAFRARAADPEWVANVPRSLELIQASAFCCGQNNRGWKADVDWYLRPDTQTKILEGKYSDGDVRGNGQPTKLREL